MGLPVLHDTSGGEEVRSRPEPSEGVLPPQCCHQGPAGDLPGDSHL